MTYKTALLQITSKYKYRILSKIQSLETEISQLKAEMIATRFPRDHYKLSLKIEDKQIILDALKGLLT